MAGIDLSAKFPEMRPIKGPPSLATVHGIGTMIYGSRDHDDETGTYVATLCLTVIFCPVLMLKAYRVANARQGGWYFIGREPLSLVAKMWNLLVLGGGMFAVGLIALTAYVNTPEYKAGQKMAQAQAAAAAGKPADAARDYRAVVAGKTSYASEAQTQLQQLVRSTADQGTMAQCTEVFVEAVDLERSYPGKLDRAQLVQGALTAAIRLQAEDPRAVLAMLDKVATIAPDPALLAAPRQPLLERVVQQQPGDVEAASQLALIYEGQKKPQLCRKLLEPLADKLGTTEGARILGQIYANGDAPEKSIALLTPYATQQLDKLHAAEKKFEDVYRGLYDRKIDEMNHDHAPGFSMASYNKLPKDQQQEMVDEYVTARIKDDPSLTLAREDLVAQGPVVSVALDLGILLLNRGQSQSEPAARERDLKQAEAMFLAVRGQAGQDDMYRLHLGQVYYWLGKHGEGRKLFDELLKQHNRQGDIALAVAGTLRAVGAVSEARPLAEELYQKESDPARKYQAAMLMALTSVEVDDKIKWQRRCDPTDRDAKASLEWLLGNKSTSEGSDEEAVAHFRAASQIYDTMTETASVLNNSALVWFSLAEITGSPDDFKQATNRLEKAAAMSRTDSILLYNTAVALSTAAVGATVRDKIDLATLKSTGSFEQLPYLYQDAAGRKQLAERLRQNRDMRRAMEYFDRVMLLAPRDVKSYSYCWQFNDLTNDTAALKALASRLKPLALDLDDYRQQGQKHYRGERDAELVITYKKAIERDQKTLAAARGKGGATLAVAAGHLAENMQGSSDVGMPADANQIVRLAEEAQQASASLGSNATLRSALLFRAAEDLARSEPTFAAMFKRSQRSLTPSDLIAVALEQPGPLRDKALANADVKRSQQIVLETAQRFADKSTGWAWAMLQTSHPAEAKKIAGALRTDETAILESHLAAKLAPYSASAALQARWRALAQGDAAGAEAALASCRQEKVPLPWDGK